MSSNTNKRIVFIESNTTGSGELFIKESLAMGLQVIFITAMPEKYNFLERHFIYPVILNTLDHDEIITYLKKWDAIDAVFSSSEFFVETATIVAKTLGLKHNELHAIRSCRDKFSLYQTLSQHSILTPETKSITEASEINQATSIDLPCIVKPRQGSGSIDVKRCDTNDQLVSHIHYILNKNNSALAQAFIEGEEFSVETMSKSGKIVFSGITKKLLSEPPYFIEIGHNFPATLSSDKKNLIETSVMKALVALNFKEGPAHTEIRIRDGKVYIIEINPRLAGGMIPQLIQEATGINIIKETIKLYLDEPLELKNKFQKYASIRFLLAKSSGTIQNIDFAPHTYANTHFFLTKSINDNITIEHNFRDRIGYIITSDQSSSNCLNTIENALNNTHILIQSTNKGESISNTGLLNKTLSPNVLSVINKAHTTESKQDDFYYYQLIDQAHIVMLNACGIITNKVAHAILNAITTLQETANSPLLDKSPKRGTYFIYENYLVDLLGIKTAGYIHTGRSRNDIAETITRMRLIEKVEQINQVLWKLRSQLLQMAKKSLQTLLPIYSQYQIALTGTLAHYLTGIEEALSRDQKALHDLFDFLSISPMGSGAGSGTSHPINPDMVSKLLGFKHTFKHSLDSIASKDLELRYLSTIAILGTTLSRLTEDLQSWSTVEFEFVSFPDELVGSSSMMPQKRNPYILEDIKAKLCILLGQQATAFTAIHKSHFANSYESKTVLKTCLNTASDLLLDALFLVETMLKGAEFNALAIEKSLKKGLTFATYASEKLSHTHLTPKEAHFQIGKTIANTDDKDNVFNELQTLLQEHHLHLSENPIDWANAQNYGNGPGKVSTIQILSNAEERLEKDGQWSQALALNRIKAKAFLLNATKTILNQTSNSKVQ